MSYKYYLTRPDKPEEEVSQTEYIVAERAEGYSNTMGQDSQPATHHFKGKYTEGRISYVPTKQE